MTTVRLVSLAFQLEIIGVVLQPQHNN